MENLGESAAVVISAVFVTREHVDSPKVLYNGIFWGFKLRHFSQPVTSEIFKLSSWFSFSKCTKFYVCCKNAKEVSEKI